MAMWNRKLGRVTGCEAPTCFDAACHGCGDGLGIEGGEQVIEVLDPRGVRRFRYEYPSVIDEAGAYVDARAVAKAAKRHGFRVVSRVVRAWGGKVLWLVQAGRVLVVALDIPGPPGGVRVRPGEQMALGFGRAA